MVQATKHGVKYTDPVKEYVGLSNLCKLKIGQFLEIIKCKGKAWSGISLEKEQSFLPWSVLYTPLYWVEVRALLGCSVEGDALSARKSPSSSGQLI